MVSKDALDLCVHRTSEFVGQQRMALDSGDVFSTDTLAYSPLRLRQI